MRDFSCFGDNSVSLAAGGGGGSGSGTSFGLDRLLQAVTASVYKAALSSRKELLVKVTWTKNNAAVTGLTVAIDEGSSPSPSSAPRPASCTLMPASTHHFLQKKRGSRSFVTEAGTVVGIYWDTAAAKYTTPSSPEPSCDYYVAVIADAEFALLLGGEAAREFARRFEGSVPPAPRCELLSRREQLRGAGGVHTTRCKFRDDGRDHEVTIQCKGDEWEPREAELSVSIDRKKVVHVRRLKWNFRGNQTVFVDGAVVDMMWDVHDWWFGHPSGAGAQFMFKTRTSAEGRLWQDEELARRGQPPPGFFLHVQNYRR